MGQDKFSRRNRTAEEMFPLVEAYRDSSLSRSAFCASRDLPISALNYWQTKYRKTHGLGSSARGSGFIELAPSAPSMEPSAGDVVMELCFGADHRLRFYGYPPADYVGQLLLIERC